MEKENDPMQNYIQLLSHQLKSPINAIETLLNTILEGYAGDLDEQARFVLKKAVSRSSEAREIISDLLDYEQYAASKDKEGDEIDIVKLCQRLETEYVRSALDKNISFHTDFPKTVGIFVLGGEQGIEHALRNLLENAFKYTAEKGSVSFTLSIDDQSRTCKFEITDTGTGLPEADLEHIFEPFFRSVIHRSGTPGTGLGLPIVKRIVDSMDGRIDVKSVEGKGSTFAIYLGYHRVENRVSEDEPGLRVVVIGGVTAGPKAAARLRRYDERIDITIVEKGGFLSYSGAGLPAYISGKVASPKALMISGDGTVHDSGLFEAIDNFTVMNNTLAVSIDREARIVKTRETSGGKESQLPYDLLILATGAVPSVPNIPGIDRSGIFTLRSLEDAEAIRTSLTAGVARDVCIIGGGLIGISAAEELQDAGARITIIEKKEWILQKMFDRDIALRLQSALNRKGIKILTNTEVTEVRSGEDRGGSHILQTNQGTYSADLIIVSAGVTSNTELAREAGLDIGESGGIIVDSRLQTSDENIYAVGDCAESTHLTTGKHEYWPLGSVSTKMGRIAADNICGSDVEFNGSIGTAIFRMRELNAARTGLTTRIAIKEGFEAVSTVITGRDNAKKSLDEIIILKIIADRETGIVIGAQGFGNGNVAGKIEIAAMAISHKLTLIDVFRLDLGYSPDYNSPIELTQTACLTLQDRINGQILFISPDEFDEKKNEFHLVSVCPPSIHPENTIPGAINIPLERLRSEGLPFERSEKIVIYSRTSAGAYKAYRFLIHRGYKSLYVLEGGYLFWRR